MSYKLLWLFLSIAPVITAAEVSPIKTPPAKSHRLSTGLSPRTAEEIAASITASQERRAARVRLSSTETTSPVSPAPLAQAAQVELKNKIHTCYAELTNNCLTRPLLEIKDRRYSDHYYRDLEIRNRLYALQNEYWEKYSFGISVQKFDKK